MNPNEASTENSNESIYSIVYISASSHLFSDEDLHAILETSRHNNTQLGVTGVLLYIEGSIFQVLEGPEATVKQLYTTISQDSRHRMILRLIEDRHPQRNFPDWSMGFRNVKMEDVRTVEGFHELRDMQEFLDVIQASPEKSHILLRTFFASNTR